MRRILVAAVAGIVVAGGAYYGLFVVPSQQFRAGLDQTIANLPPGYSAHYGSARFSLLSHTAIVTDLALQTPGAVAATVAKLEVVRPDLDLVDQWNKAQANPALFKPDQPLAVADRVSITGVKLAGGQAAGTIESFSIEKARLYPWALVHPGVPPFVDAVKAFSDTLRMQREFTAEQQKLAATGSVQSPEIVQQRALAQFNALMPILRLEASLVLGFGVDSIESGNIDVTVSGSALGDPASSNLRLAIRHLHDGALDRGVGGAYTSDGLVEELGSGMKVSVEHSETGKIMARDALTRVLNGDPWSLAMLNGTSLEGLKFTGMSGSMPQGGTFQIDSMTIPHMAFDRGFFTSLGFSMSGMKQHVADLPQPDARAAYGAIGLDTLTLSFGLSMQWDPDKKTVALRDTVLTIDELGSLHLTADLADIDPATQKTPYPGLIGATLRYDDASLIDRLVNAKGKRTPEQAAQMRKQFAAGVLMNMNQFASDQRIAAAAKAISAFAETPHSLTITLAPQTPVPVASIQALGAQGPIAVFQTLGVMVAANQ
jgi:hypothetical protein